MAASPIALLAIAAGAYYLLSGSSSGGPPTSTAGTPTNTPSMGQPTFYNMAKQPISSIKCGASAIFDVPGYSLVWLDRTKNGVADFSGPYAVPAPPYVMSCSSDVGSYTITVYQLNADGSKGTLLGSTTFTVTQSS